MRKAILLEALVQELPELGLGKCDELRGMTDGPVGEGVSVFLIFGP